MFTTVIDEIMQSGKRGATPQLRVLRDDFHNAIYEVLQEAHYRNSVGGYPIPSEAVRLPDKADRSSQ